MVRNSLSQLALRFLALAFFASGADLLAETPDHAFLGLMTESKVEGDPKSGLRVTYVFPHSSAEEMGFKAGDEIVALNDVIIESLTQFMTELRRERIDATVSFLVQRAGESKWIPLRGKIGSYKRTMTKFEEDVRKRLVGESLPKLPRVLWWDDKEKKLSDTFDLEKAVAGKVAIFYGFDSLMQPIPRPDNSVFIPSYLRFQETSRRLGQIIAKDSFVVVSLFRDERILTEKGEEAMIAAAKEIFVANPPVGLGGVILFPEEMEPREREDLFFLRNRGVALVGGKGKIEYLQVFDDPGPDFLRALQKALEENGTPLVAPDPRTSTGPSAPSQNPPQNPPGNDAPKDNPKTNGTPSEGSSGRRDGATAPQAPRTEAPKTEPSAATGSEASPKDGD